MEHSGPSQSSPLPWAGCPQPHPRPRAPPGMGIHNNPRSLSSNTQSSHRQTEERLSLHSIWTWSAWHWTTNDLVIKLITSYAPSVKPAPFLPGAQTQTAIFDPTTQKGCSASFQGAKVLHVCWVSQSSFQKRGYFLVFSLNEYWESSHPAEAAVSLPPTCPDFITQVRYSLKIKVKTKQKNASFSNLNSPTTRARSRVCFSPISTGKKKKIKLNLMRHPIGKKVIKPFEDYVQCTLVQLKNNQHLEM